MATDCPFCALPPDRMLQRNSSSVSFLDRFPLSEGHTLVVPRRHVASLFDLDELEGVAVWALVAEVRLNLQHTMKPDGFTIGVNDGEAAGQTVGHAHVHVVPRFAGDVPDPRGGIRWVIPSKAAYWEGGSP